MGLWLSRLPEPLLVYASMMGSTGETTELMAQVAREAGFGVYLTPVQDAPDPKQFDAVILGSAIKTGNWLEEMIEYAKRSEAALQNMPLALFQCSMRCAGYMRANGQLDQGQRQSLQTDAAGLMAAAPALPNFPAVLSGISAILNGQGILLRRFWPLIHFRN